MDKLISNFLKFFAVLIPFAFAPDVGEFFNLNRWVVSGVMLVLYVGCVIRLFIILRDVAKESKDAQVSDDEVVA